LLLREPAGAVREQPGGIQLDRHVGEHELDALVARYLDAELLALLCVPDRRVVRRLRDAHCLGGDGDPARIDGLERDAEPLSFLAQQVLRRDPAVVEHEFGGRRRVDTHLVLHLADREARRAALHDEGADALVAKRLVSGRERRHEVGLGSVRDEDLVSVEDERVTVLLVPHVEVGDVAAGHCLGQCEGHGGAVGDPGDVLRLLLVVAVHRYGVHRESERHDVRDTETPGPPGDLLRRQYERQLVAGAAVLLREADAVQADFRHLLHHVVRELVGLVPRGGAGLNLVDDEVPDHRLEHLVLFAKFEIHV